MFTVISAGRFSSETPEAKPLDLVIRVEGGAYAISDLATGPLRFAYLQLAGLGFPHLFSKVFMEKSKFPEVEYV